MAMRLYGSIASDHPGPDGIEVVSRIRERNPKQAIAVVAVYESRAQSIRHRFKIPMLPIPFPRTQLVKLVESVTKPKLRMLLVAGDPAVKPLTAAYWNFEIEMESTGNKALEHHRKGGSYDIVVTGYQHRGLDGVDLALAIRRVNPAQRIVVITAESSAAASEGCGLRSRAREEAEPSQGTHRNVRLIRVS
jgi:CheY-like chemotaxis protein